MPRIHGTEMEWNVLVPEEHQFPRTLMNSEFIRCVKEYLSTKPHAGCGDNYFLSNGARLYGDTGDHLEYATPEDNSFIGTAANEIVGEKIVRAVLDAPVDLGAYCLNKRVIDDNGVTSGYHESYCVDASSIEISEEGLALLGLHLATRIIFAGAGILRRTGDFLLAQKFPQLVEDCSCATTSNKPVINTRDEPLADYSRWRRVHVTSGDPNMSPWATRMKLGTTSLVLGLIENGRTLDNLRFAEPLFEIGGAVARDLLARNRYQLENTGSASAIEVQDQLLSAVRSMDHLSDEELWTVDEWGRALQDLRDTPLNLADRADWAARYKILDSYHDRRGVSWQSEQLRMVDRLFDDTREDGIGQKLRQSKWAKYMPPTEMITSRVSGATPETRAKIRGEFIKRLWGKADITTDWNFCVIGKDSTANNGNRVKLDDPTATYDERVEALGRSIPALVA